MSKLEFVKQTSDYIKQRQWFWYILIVGIILIALFIGLSFVNRTFQTIASITFALTLVLCILIHVTSFKIKKEISKELTSMLLTQIIDIKIIGKKEKYKYKDFQNSLKEIKNKFNISLDNEKKSNQKK